MIRILGFILVVVGCFGLTYEITDKKIPEWEHTTQALFQEAKNAKLDQERWKKLVKKSHTELPHFYPFSRIQNILEEAHSMVVRAHNFPKNASIDFSFAEKQISAKGLQQIFVFLRQNQNSVEQILDDLQGLPTFLFSEEKNKIYKQEITLLEYLNTQLKDAQKFEHIFNKFLKDKERVLVLLQNQNEPRPTGGFAGSLVLFDFLEDHITWKFLDIYAIDRLVPPKKQILAPPYFHGLSKTISLRDANFWPDFSKSARAYRYFLESAGYKSPKTVVAINLNLIKEVLKLTGPIEFPKWNLSLDAHNFDVGLQFLVESKITGRFGVKEPVEIFAQKLFSPESINNLSWSDWAVFDLEAFLQQKNILAHSQNRGLQKLFEKWKIDGQLRQKNKVDNFLHVDVVSIGANKSEKFTWTKINHDSEIKSDGTVLNTVKIKRTHALKNGEIQDLLGTNKFAPNIKTS